MSLLTVGTVAFDDIETPFGKAERIVGGSCSYAGMAASYFTKPVQVVSVIGDDFPEDELDHMSRMGLDMEGLQRREGEKSFFWAGKYHRNLNNRDTLTTELNVLADFDPVLPESYKDSQYILLGNLTPAVQMRVIEQLNRPRIVALDTMNYWIENTPDSLAEVIAQVDLLIINDEEARQLSGEYSLVKAAYKIHEMGPPILAIKKGEHGALLFEKQQMFYAPALPLAEVFDPTGAGDTFAGGMMGYIAKTEDLSFNNLKRAIIHGSAMASFCVEAFGISRIKGLSQKEINQRVQDFVKLVHFDV